MYLMPCDFVSRIFFIAWLLWLAGAGRRVCLCGADALRITPTPQTPAPRRRPLPAHIQPAGGIREKQSRARAGSQGNVATFAPHIEQAAGEAASMLPWFMRHHR